MKIFLIFVAAAACISVTLAQSTGTFIATGSMTTARSQHTATLLTDGKVLITGGAQRSQPLAPAEIYDPSTGTFTATGQMTKARVLHSATLLPDGRVLIIGDDSTAEIYDPPTGTFTATGDMATFYACNTTTLLANGLVLSVDDPYAFKRVSKGAQLYDPASGSFLPTGTYASAELAELDRTISPGTGGWDCPRAILLPNGKVLMVQGVFAELYHPDTGAFSLTGTQITFANGFVKTVPPVWYDPSRATLLLNGMVLFNGGDDDLGPAASAWLYDPSTGKFHATWSMATARSNHTATLLPDGTVLAAGGFKVGSYFGSAGALGTAELYDPATGTFSNTGEMATPRYGHTATLLADGRVLIAGGTTGLYPNTFLSSTELYDPAVLIPAPRLFSVFADGQNQGAIWHAASGEVASQRSPATAGDVLAMYTTGLVKGGLIPPQVAVGGRLAEVIYFGAAPNYPGYNQVNFRLPNSAATGSAVPVRLTYLSRTSNEATIAVR